MSSDPARRRFFMLQALRWSGVAMVLIGLAIARGRIALPPQAGYALVAIGLIDALLLPTLLIRRWKTPGS